MAFPTVAARNSSQTTSISTSHTVNLPTGISSGDLLLALFVADNNFNNGSIAWPAGWTEISGSDIQGGPVQSAIAWREATGSEGSTITVNTDNSELAEHYTWRITGAEDPDTQAPEMAVAGTTKSATPDPPNLTPTGGAKDYLWIVGIGMDRANTVNSYPTNYSSGQRNSSNGGSQGCTIAAAERNLNAASENPGTFSTGNEDWNAYTVAVHPAAGGAAYSITGAVTVAQTIAATMLEGRTIAGAVTVGQTIAADMVEGRTIAGAVTVDQVIAATMIYARNYAITGDVTVAQTIAAQMLEGRVIAGAVTVDQTIAAAMEFAGAAAIIGDVTVAQTIAALMLEGRVIAGDVTVDQTIAAQMLEGRVIAGDVTVTQAIAAGMIFGIAYEIAGAITVSQTIAADMLEGRVIAGAITVNQTIAALMLEGRVLAGDITVSQAIAAAMVYAAGGAAEIVGDVTVSQTIAALMLEGRVLAGDITVDQAIAAAMVYAAAPAGDCITPTTILEGTLTWEEAMRIVLAAAAGKSSGLPNAPKYRDQADTKDRIDATTDGIGNRSSVTVDGS